MAEIHGPSDRRRWNDIRTSDAERNQVVEMLQQHFVDGRLTSDDLTERIDHVYRSQTRGELQRVLDDLPAPTAPSASPASKPATAKGGTDGQRMSTGRLVLMVIAAIVLVPVAIGILEELTPLLIIAVVVWLVQRNRRQKSC